MCGMMRFARFLIAGFLMIALSGFVPAAWAQEAPPQRRLSSAIIERLEQNPHLDGRYAYSAPRGGFIGDIAYMDLELNEVGDLPPLIVMVGGSEGGWSGRGTGLVPPGALGGLLADMGYSIRNLNHFGLERLGESWGEDLRPPRLFDRDLEPFAEVLNDARQTRGAVNRCVGFVGVSRGGELTLLLAAYESDLNTSETRLFDAAVAAVPSHVVWQGPHRTLRIRSSWALAGEPLDFVPFPWLSIHTPRVLLSRSSTTASSEQALRNHAAVQRALIPVERIEAPVLMQGALEDHLWPSAEMADAAFRRAEALNPDHGLVLKQYPVDHYVLSYPDAVADAAIFLDDTLRQTHSEGRCEASF